MAQQNSPLTRSNVNQATSVSPLGHESSPKNDISCSLLTRKPFFSLRLGVLLFHRIYVRQDSLWKISVFLLQTSMKFANY